MITVLVCDRDAEERQLLGRDCRSQVASHSTEDLSLESLPNDAALTNAIASEYLANLLYYDFQGAQSIQVLRMFRKSCAGAMVMLITDSSVSPLEYLRPGAAPDALLLRPIEEARLSETNREFITSFLDRLHGQTDTERFVVDTRDEKILLSWSQIYYFEAREKKVYVRTRHEEYAFYDTMDALEERVPACFVRCHRSYLINTDKIISVHLREHYLELPDNMGVPISRSCRPRFREWTEQREAHK